MNIAFIDTVHPILQKTLEKNGYNCIDYTATDRSGLLKQMDHIHGVVIRSRTQIDRTFIDAAPQLRFIARSGSGMENIDTDYARHRGIQCFNSPEGNQQAVAEHTLGMLLGLLNHLNRSDREVRRGLWQRELNRGVELQSLTVGIIGYGYMGAAFARVLGGIGCRVMVYDKYRSGFGIKDKIEEVSLETLQQQSQVISIHLPLTAETEWYIDRSFIQACRHPFWLLNTSRGNQLVLKDLLWGLKEGRILGAALDVLEYEQSSFEQCQAKERPEWTELVAMDQVVFSPHVAGWTHESYQKLSEVLATKILGEFGRIEKN